MTDETTLEQARTAYREACERLNEAASGEELDEAGRTVLVDRWKATRQDFLEASGHS